MEERYARQTMLPEIGEQGQRRLSEASVLIVGIGGLGSAAALYLTGDRKSTRLNSSHTDSSRMPSSA